MCSVDTITGTGDKQILLRIGRDMIFGLLVAGLALLFLSSPAGAQQRLIVEKATGNVVDVGDQMLQYDSRYFDNMDFANNPIPSGADVRKYVRNAAGAIVLRPKDELVKNFSDEWRDDLIARINSSALASNVKTLLIEIVKGMRR